MSRIMVLAGVVWREMLRKKDFYVLLVLLIALTLALFTVDTFGAENAARYVLDLGLLMIWIFSIVLTVVLSARQIPAEEKRGTIYALLAKPVSRMELLLGKWLGCWTASAAATLIFFAFLTLVTILRGGALDPSALLQCWLLYVCLLAVVSALTLALSTRMTYGASATTSLVVQGAVFALVPRIPVLVGYEQGLRRTLLIVIYYLLPHYELFDMRRRLVHEWGALPWTAFALVAAYAAALTTALLLLAWLGYRGKHFKRGAAV
jgi:Cu-processing system permease protein